MGNLPFDAGGDFGDIEQTGAGRRSGCFGKRDAPKSALATWRWHGLKELGVLPAVCVDARQAKAALSGRVNKSDALNAEGLAQLAQTGWCAEVNLHI